MDIGVKKLDAGGIGKAIRCMKPFDRKAYGVGAAIGRPSVIVSANQEIANGAEDENSPPGEKDNVITDCILRTRNARPYTRQCDTTGDGSPLSHMMERTLFILRCATW